MFDSIISGIFWYFVISWIGAPHWAALILSVVIGFQVLKKALEISENKKKITAARKAFYLE